MDLLLDTHTVLWFVAGSNRLSAKALGLIEDPSNRIMVSAVSLFEVSIKLKVGKLRLDMTLKENYELITNSFIQVVPITTTHLLEYQNIPLYADHRDPFDRMIIATAVVEKAKIITVDPKFQYYQDLVDLIW